MKILVIGKSGQLARSLQELAHSFRHNVKALGRPELDLIDAATVVHAFERESPDLVINAAAYTAVDRAEEEEELAFAINAQGPAILSEQCARRNIPLIHISTDYVFDGAKPAPYREDDPLSPLGVYGRSKAKGEQAVMERAEKYIILRTAWVYSPFGHNFVKTMLRLAGERDKILVVDDQYGSPTYAPHLAKAIAAIIARLADDEMDSPWGVYHAAGGEETTWCGLAREIFARSREGGGAFAKIVPVTTKDYPAPARRPANSRLDCSKLQRVFGIALPRWREGVAECVGRLIKEQEK